MPPFLFGGCVLVGQIYFVYVKGFVGLYDCRTGGHIPFNVKSVFLVEVGKVFVVRVLRYIVLIAEKGAHAAQLQNSHKKTVHHQPIVQFVFYKSRQGVCWDSALYRGNLVLWRTVDTNLRLCYFSIYNSNKYIMVLLVVIQESLMIRIENPRQFGIEQRGRQ